MIEFLYCIKDEKMVPVAHYNAQPIHLNTVRVSNSPDPGDRFDVEECLFPLGWATCPPPESNIEFLAEQDAERVAPLW